MSEFKLPSSLYVEHRRVACFSQDQDEEISLWEDEVFFCPQKVSVAAAVKSGVKFTF